MPEKDPNEPVRVRDKDTGHELTIRRISLPHGNYEELTGVDAVDPITQEFVPPVHATEPRAAETVAAGGSAYAGRKKAALQAEVAARNDARGDEEPQIEVAGKGTVKDLIAALEADDAAQANAQANHQSTAADTTEES